jgi:hypothetical protein
MVAKETHIFTALDENIAQARVKDVESLEFGERSAPRIQRHR